MTEFEKTVNERNEYAALKAVEDSKALTLPQTPEAYAHELPADFKLPEGIDVKIDANDPAMAAAKAWAHANKVPQAEFSKLLALNAGILAAKEQKVAALSSAHLEGLGAAKEARIDAVTRWLTNSYGEKAKPIIATLATKDHVEVFESIMQKVTSQGSAGFSQNGRVVETGKVSDESWSKMSYGDKKAYAEKHGGRAA